jgi:S1-C subfamily serine protease
LLGVRTDFERLNLDQSLGYRSGAIVTEVVDGYGARAAGLRPFKIGTDRRIEEYGDVIVAIDGQRVRSYSELPLALSSRNSGDVVRVTAIRGLPDNPRTVTLDIEMRTQDEPIDAGM